MLELHHGLDINSDQHIWLLHVLFLPLINQELELFRDSWNFHKIQLRNGPNRSPIEMFGFDMMVHGVRGDALSNDELSDEELEVYGVDWEGLVDEQLLQSQQNNNFHTEGSSSWIRAGPPDTTQMSNIQFDPPLGPNDTPNQIMDQLHTYLRPWQLDDSQDSYVIQWTHALTFFAHTIWLHSIASDLTLVSQI